MKINRLLEITIILLNKGTVTARSLAERFNVSVRTIYRDIDVLSGAGVPVYTSKGNGGGISLMEGYCISRTMITQDESEGLLLALKTMKAAKYPEIDMVLDKIGHIFKNAKNTEWVDVDFMTWGSDPNEKNKFLDIKEAIIKKKVIFFKYINADGRKSERYAEPVKFIFKGHAWYLSAFCRQRNSMRTFRLSRIRDVVITDETFEQRQTQETTELSEGAEKPLVCLKLKFSPHVLNRIYDDFDFENVTTNDDGTFDVEMTFPEDEWIYGYLMSFGPNVEVLEPIHIREGIKTRLVKSFDIYNKT